MAQRQLALSVQLRMDGEEPTLGVAIARYFLADLYCQQGDALAAIATVKPFLKEGVELEWLMRCVNAQSLEALGLHVEASHEAEIAVAIAPFEAKQKELLEVLAPILNSGSTVRSDTHNHDS